MSYREWLYYQLIGDEVIDEDDYTTEELTKEVILQETEVEELDLENYESQFIEHCKGLGVDPDWDLE